MLWFLIGAVALAGWSVLIYNGLVRLRVLTNGAWADIENHPTGTGVHTFVASTPDPLFRT